MAQRASELAQRASESFLRNYHVYMSKKQSNMQTSSNRIEAHTSNEKHTSKSRMQVGSSMGFGVAQ